MSDNAFDRRRARTMARAAQGLVVLLAGAGVAAVMILPAADGPALPADPLEGLDAAIAAKIAEAAAGSAEVETVATLPPDWEAVAYAYHAATDIPFEDEAEEPETDEPAAETEGGETVEATGEDGTRPSNSIVRFLGRLTVGDRAVALVAVDGQQAFIAEGDSRVLGLQESTRVEVEIVRVSDTELELVQSGEPFTVTMAERTAAAISTCW